MLVATTRYKIDDIADLKVPMHQSEEDEIGKLFQSLIHSGRSSLATLVYTLPYSGISYAIERLLPRQAQFEAQYAGGIHHLHMDALAYTSDARRTLRGTLAHKVLLQPEPDVAGTTAASRPTDATLATRIALHLHQQGQLLVIHGATAIPDNSQLYEDLSNELQRLSEEKGFSRVSRLILTCWDDGAYSYLNNRRARQFRYDPKVGGEDAVAYFQHA